MTSPLYPWEIFISHRCRPYTAARRGSPKNTNKTYPKIRLCAGRVKMATGGKGDVDDDLTSGHDVVFDWTCGQCDDDGKTNEATAYCQDCEEGFCDPCLKIHRRFPAMRNHKVLDKSQTDSWGNGAVVRGYSHPCQDHDDQTISMYCGDHDVVCCPVCVALDHKGCDDMAYIPKISKGIVKSQEFLKTQNDMSKAIAEAEKALDDGKNGNENLICSRREAVEEVREAKQEVVDHFDRLEDEAIAKIDKLYEKLENESGEIVDACSDACQELKSLHQQMKSDKSVSDSEAFVRMKLGQKKVSECHSVSKQLSDAMSTELFKVIFSASPDLQDAKAIAVIGDVEMSREGSLYTLRREYECSLRVQGERYDTTVCGVYRLPDSNFLLSDQPNCKLKLLDSKYKVVAHCQLPGPPSQISSTDKVSPTEVVVALLNSSLQFASVTNHIRLTKRIDLKHKCNGLLFCDGKIYVSGFNKTVYIYTFLDKKLTLLKTVTNDEDEIPLFSYTEDIIERTGGIIVADGNKGIICLDLDGTHQTTMKHPDVGGCFKAVPDNHGNMFVIKGDGSLTQLSDDGKTMTGIIATDAQQFYLDTSNSMLYVWCYAEYGGSQRLKIFER